MASAPPQPNVNAWSSLIPGRPSVLRGAMLLALVAAIAFWPVLSGQRMFFHIDLRYEHLPVWSVVQKALMRGESPFWIDGEYCGHPLLFTQEAPVFYPLMTPLLLTGASVGRLADVFSLIHFWIAGLAAFLFLREFEAEELSAVAAGVAWMLSARVLQSAIWPNAVAVMALIPFLLLGIVRIADGRYRSGVLFASGAGGLILLAARPQVILGAAPFLLVVTVILLARAGGSRAAAAGHVVLAAVLALALGAASLLPSALLYPEMSRWGGLAPADRDVQTLGRGERLDIVFLPVDGLARWPEPACYPGIAVGLAFAAGVVIALRRAQGFPRGLFLAVLGGGTVGLIFAFGERGPYGWIAGLPLLSGFRFPVRFLASWALAVTVGGGLTIAWIVRRSSRPRLAGAVALCLVAGDLVLHARLAAPTAPRGLDAVKPRIVEPLLACVGTDEAGFPHRVWSLAERVNLLFFAEEDRVAVAERFDPLIFALGIRFGLESVDGGGPPLTRTAAFFARPIARAAEIAGAKCLVVSSPVASGRPSDPRVVTGPALPRALLVAQAVAVRPEKAVAVTLAPQVDLRQMAIVEAAEPLRSPSAQEPPGTVRLVSRRPGRVDLSTDSVGDRVLVVFDAFAPGWTARIDGEPADVFRADGAFRGVRVPAGRHRVVEEYRAPGVREGLGLSIAGLLGLALVAVRMASSRTAGGC
jgi:hypothetical protein